MTSQDERNQLIIDQFIAAIVGTGRTRKEAITMIDSKGLTVTDMEESLELIEEVLGQGLQLMRSRRGPVSESELFLDRLILGQSPYSEDPKTSGGGKSLEKG